LSYHKLSITSTRLGMMRLVQSVIHSSFLQEYGSNKMDPRITFIFCVYISKLK